MAKNSSKETGSAPSTKKGRDLLTIIQNVERGIGAKKGEVHLVLLSKEGDDKLSSSIVPVPTGLMSIDKATNLGGLPKGRIVEIYGPESSGKSWIAIKCVAAAQKLGMICAYLDVENSVDKVWLSRNGVNVDRLIYGKDFNNGEQALDAVYKLCLQKADVVVIDSTAALVPKAELEGSMQDTTVAELARMMSKGIRKINDACGKNDTLVIFINQVRMKAGFVLGNPEETPGGKALKFYASMRLDVRPRGKIIDKEKKVVGINSRVKIVKNKVAAPFEEAMFTIFFNPEMANDPCRKLVDLAMSLKQVSLVKGEEAEENDQKVYAVGKGKGKSITTAKSPDELIEWLSENEELTAFLDVLVEVAIEEGVDMDEIVSSYIESLRNPNAAGDPTVADAEADAPPADPA